MINYEKIKNMGIDEMAEFMCEIRSSCLIGCAGCKDDELCIERRKEWLKQEAKPTLSEAERIILENIPKEYIWIARDENNYLFVFENKPTKDKDKSSWQSNGLDLYEDIFVFNHLFQFITWEDEQAYNIAELLKGE